MNGQFTIFVNSNRNLPEGLRVIGGKKLGSKFTCLFILLAIIVCGCSTNQSPSPNKPNGGGLLILQGTTLEELGLELNVERLRHFEDHNQEQISYYVNHYSAAHKKYAKTSGLLVEFSEYLGSQLLISIQGFKKPARQDVQPLIEVNSSFYHLSDLTRYQLYEDDETIVFDITNLLPEKFADRVQTWLDYGVPCQWMFEVYEYVKTYDDIVITRLGE